MDDQTRLKKFLMLNLVALVTQFTVTVIGVRANIHPFGGADRVLPEWIGWGGGGGVIAEIFRDPYSVGGGVVA